MTPYDAIFVALVASRCLERPNRWWLVLLAPAFAYGIGCWEPMERFAAPMSAIAAVALAPRWAPVSLLLVIPVYETLAQAVGTAVVWVTLDALFDTILERLRHDAIAPRLQGWPIRLLILGILYYTLLPLAWL
jgi:hypothetical protein